MPAASVEQVLALPVIFPAVDAGRLGFDLPPGTTYQLVREGRFPCSVIHVGKRVMVRRSDLLAALGIEDRPPGISP